jgi:hypothetical protein
VQTQVEVVSEGKTLQEGVGFLPLREKTTRVAGGRDILPMLFTDGLRCAPRIRRAGDFLETVRGLRLVEVLRMLELSQVPGDGADDVKRAAGFNR